MVILIVAAIGFIPLKAWSECDVAYGELDIDHFFDYTKKFESYDAGVCAPNSTKTYMDYRAVTLETSRQYIYMRNHMTVDGTTGLLYDKDGFIGAALGSYYGSIGDRFYFTLSNGQVLPIVKIDAKSDAHVSGGCAHANDGSVIEFVIDTDYAGEYFGRSSNGYVAWGNFNNIDIFNGYIVRAEYVTDTISSSYVEYVDDVDENIDNENIFNYASGY